MEVEPLSIYEKIWIREGIAALGDERLTGNTEEERVEAVFGLAEKLLDLLESRGLIEPWSRSVTTADGSQWMSDAEWLRAHRQGS